MKSSTIAMWVMSIGLLSATGLASAADSDASDRPLARSEVLADLEVWQRSGMHALSAIDEPPGVSEQHRVALAAYHALRNGPEYARIVARIARELGERIDVADLNRR